MLSLPKGILAFVIAVTGLCASLPLIIVWVGLPLLALTLAWCRRMMSSEQQLTRTWSNSRDRRGTVQPVAAEYSSAFRWEGLRTLGQQLRDGGSYRGILYSLMQLPAGICRLHSCACPALNGLQRSAVAAGPESQLIVLLL